MCLPLNLIFFKILHPLNDSPTYRFKILKLIHISRYHLLFLLFPKVAKLDISAIYEAIVVFLHWMLLWYLSTSFVKRNFNPTTRRTSRTSYSWSLTKKMRASQKFINTKMTGRVDILMCILEKSAKRMKPQDQRNIVFGKEAICSCYACIKGLSNTKKSFIWTLCR